MDKIIYSDNLSERNKAKCYYPFPYMFGLGECTIVVRPKYKNNQGIINHELEHERQYKEKWFHSQMYLLSKSYRFECELKAYTKELEYRHTKTLSDCRDIVGALTDTHNIGYSREYVEARVQQVIERINQ